MIDRILYGRFYKGDSMSRITKEEVKERVCKAIVDAQPRLRELAESIMAEPELGFKEVKTSKKVQDMFYELGISYTTGHALTGVKGRMKGRDSKYTVAMVGELDAILCPRHPRADDLTGAAHCCGHNVQITNMFAVAMGLQAVMDQLAGDVVLFAVPAEEMIEIDYRNKLREQGKLKYMGGKQQLIYEGAFDDIDMAMQMHVETAKTPAGEMGLGSTSNGFVSKLIEYHGKVAHAAQAPHEGINALNAALMGVMGLTPFVKLSKKATISDSTQLLIKVVHWLTAYLIMFKLKATFVRPISTLL